MTISTSLEQLQMAPLAMMSLPSSWTRIWPLYGIAGYNSDIIVSTGRTINPLGGDSTDYCLYRPVQVQEESLPDLGISLFPNPASATFRLKLPASINKCELRVLDMSGREVLVPQIYRGGEVDIESLPAGIFIVEASTNKGQQRLKLVRN